MQMRFATKSVSAERFLEHDQAPPKQVQVSTNVNITSIQPIRERLKVSFITAMTYSPSIAQVTIRGDMIILDEKPKLTELLNAHREGRAVPESVIRAIMGYSIVEATVLTRSLNIPPPFPVPGVKSVKPKKKKPGPPSYVA